MRFSLAIGMFAAPLLAVSALADEPRETGNDTEASDAKKIDEAEEEKAKEKRICRYIRADASSRRKTKVCRTTEEWRELNNLR